MTENRAARTLTLRFRADWIIAAARMTPGTLLEVRFSEVEVVRCAVFKRWPLELDFPEEISDSEWKRIADEEELRGRFESLSWEVFARRVNRAAVDVLDLYVALLRRGRSAALVELHGQRPNPKLWLEIVCGSVDLGLTRGRRKLTLDQFLSVSKPWWAEQARKSAEIR